MAKIICTGLGPGDPELMSVRSYRLIQSARQIAFFRKKGRSGVARQIVDGLLPANVIEYAMEYPVTTEIAFDSPEYVAQLAAFYDDWAARLASIEGEVIVLCEGDPFFYGSFMHLHARLKDRTEVEIVPGISGMSGCWTATGEPITWGDDVLTVLMGTLPEDELIRHIKTADALVIMKTGRNLAKIRRAFAAADRLDDAWLVERGTMDGQTKVRLAEAKHAECPYFSIVLLHGKGRRPEVRE